MTKRWITNKDEQKQQLLTIIKDGGTREAPISLQDICDLCDWAEPDDTAKYKRISSFLSDLKKTHKHLHYRPVDSGRKATDGRQVSIKGYFLDYDVKNPDYGKTRLKAEPGKVKARESVSRKPVQPSLLTYPDDGPWAKPAATLELPNVAPYAPSGGVSVACRDYRINPDIVVSEAMLGTAIRTVNLFIEQNAGMLTLNIDPDTSKLKATLAETIVIHKTVGE